MLKRITLILFAVLLIGAFAQAATKAAPAAAPALTKVQGTVQAIDAAKHTVTVQIGTATEGKAFTTTDKTTYTMDGKKAKATDLKAGQNVTIEADAQNVAHSIAVTTATPAAK